MLFDLQYKLESETSERRKESNKLCMPCNELYLGPLEEDNENLNLLSREIDEYFSTLNRHISVGL
jgi:hypothetical protein